LDAAGHNEGAEKVVVILGRLPEEDDDQGNSRQIVVLPVGYDRAIDKVRG